MNSPAESATPVAERSQVMVSLRITDFECPAEEITRLLGLSPTRTWRRGEAVHLRAHNARHRQNGWRLSAPCDPSTTGLAEQLEALLCLVAPHAEQFAALPPGSEVELSCFIYACNHRPVITFSADAVRRLARLGAAIDVDCYDLTAAE